MPIGATGAKCIREDQGGGVGGMLLARLREEPLLGAVARPVLGVPASSAVLERDFGEAGKLLSHGSASISPTSKEMMMFSKGSVDSIFLEFDDISWEYLETRIPDRL